MKVALISPLLSLVNVDQHVTPTMYQNMIKIRNWEDLKLSQVCEKAGKKE